MGEGLPMFVMLAGPNGAGKSTFYEVYLKKLGLPFLNADVLARSTGQNPYEAARGIAELRDGMIRRQQSFIAETVFSDPKGEKVQVLAGAAEAGFDTTLIYIGITSAKLSHERVRARVAAGGHDVPSEKLEARYQRSLANLKRSLECLPRILVYDNSAFNMPYRFPAEFRSGECLRRGDEPAPAWARDILE